MRKLSKILLIGFMFFSTASFAQTSKFAHIDSAVLISLMPERDSAYIKINRYAVEMDETFQEMQTELQTKLTAYQQRQATWTAAVLEAKEKELNELSQRLEQYQQSAQAEMSQLQSDLFTPIMAKASDALQKIGKERGFIYIFDTSTRAIPYVDLTQSEDILPLAKRELGIPAEKVAPSQINVE